MRLTTNGAVILEFAVSVFFGIAAAAQARTDTLALQVGSRVRVSSSSSGLFGSPKVGSVLAQRGDTLSFRPEGTQDSVSLPIGSITQLEVSGGRHAHVGKGMSLGLIGGALAGVVIGAVTYTQPACSGTFLCVDLGPGASAAAGGVLGGLLGTVVGAAIGAVPTEYWDPVRLAARIGGLRLQPSPTGGVMLSGTF